MSFGSSLAQGAASSLVTGALNGAVGGLMNRIFLGSPDKQLSRQWQYQQQQMNHQAALNRKQYDYEFEKEAAYNDPSAVRARLEKAGLNPALMYGQGAGSPGVSASLGSVSGSSLSSPHGTMNVNGNPLAGSEIEAMSSKSRLDAANARLAEAKAVQQEWETTFLNPFKTRISESEALSAEAKAIMDKYAAQLSEANFETDKKLKIQQLKNFVTEQEKMLSEIDHLKASADEKDQRAALNKSLKDQAEAMARKTIVDALLSEKRLDVWNNIGIDPAQVSASGLGGTIATALLYSHHWQDKLLQSISSWVNDLGIKLTDRQKQKIEDLGRSIVEQFGEGVFYSK